MAGKQSLRDVAHKLNGGLILSVGGQSPPVITGYLRWRSLLESRFFLHLSFMAPHQTQCSAVHTFTAEGGSCSECVLCIYLCFTCLLEHTRGTHRGLSFNFGQLLLLHLNPHNNWPPHWPNVHHQCNEAKILDRWSVTPWCNRSPPYLVPCCCVRSTQSSLLKTG